MSALTVPLQFDLEILRTVRLASEGLSVVLGLAISYIALRGYLRNQSRPMLFVAAGFLLVVGLPTLLAVVLLGLFTVPTPVVNSLIQASEVAGLAAILYGLWTPGD